MAISIELDKETEQHLQKLAKRTGKATAVLLQELIARGLEDLDDLHLADAMMEKVAAGTEPVYSSDQVRKHLGLEGSRHWPPQARLSRAFRIKTTDFGLP